MLPTAKGGLYHLRAKALRTGEWCRKGLSTHLSLGGLEEGELPCGRCLGVWSMAGTQEDKEQKEEQGCSVLSRTPAQSQLRKYFDAGEVVPFHPSEQRARLGHTALCLAGTTVNPVNCQFAPKKFRGLGQHEEKLVQTQMSVVFRAASRCAGLSVPQFPHQKGIMLLLFWHAVQGLNEAGFV